MALLPSHLYDAPPLGLALAFGLTTLVTVIWFWRAARQAMPHRSGSILLGLLTWLAIQAGLTVQGLYLHLEARPPYLLLLGILPTLLVIGGIFATVRGRRFVDALPLGSLTYLNVVRVPVELVLYGLYISGQVPELMTFTGRNPDMLAGLTAPLVGFWGFTRGRLLRPVLLLWHGAALLLLLNIVGWAIMASPLPLQQVAFDQPNVAVLKFPFVWLPSVVVPLVLFGHLVALRQLMRATVPVGRLAAGSL
ncbi:hypothetical protein [Hymenobacter sublimis]|uniref:Uncharacterized protein n=1 Tax=Hymenobacter sublimis TaxID=2933777 RepID=A0ABY4JBM1_9BACT|nr:hypothetical protein [Hymenobacter sublimis]UPL49861.1 hypothetical protein MWH26_02850 [Hymenobacter sublimis]